MQNADCSFMMMYTKQLCAQEAMRALNAGVSNFSVRNLAAEKAAAEA